MCIGSGRELKPVQYFCNLYGNYPRYTQHTSRENHSSLYTLGKIPEEKFTRYEPEGENQSNVFLNLQFKDLYP